MPAVSIIGRIAEVVGDDDRPKKKQAEALRKALKRLGKKRDSLKKRLDETESDKKKKRLRSKLKTNRLHRKKAIMLLRARD